MLQFSRQVQDGGVALTLLELSEREDNGTRDEYKQQEKCRGDLEPESVQET